MPNGLFDAIERKLLADLFDELGPDAPTLLDPWTTRALAAHLILREHDYLAAPGLVLPGAWAASPNDEEPHARVKTSAGGEGNPRFASLDVRTSCCSISLHDSWGLPRHPELGRYTESGGRVSAH